MTQNGLMFACEILNMISDDCVESNSRSMRITLLQKIATKYGLDTDLENIQNILTRSGATLEVIQGVLYDEYYGNDYEDCEEKEYLTITLGDYFLSNRDVECYKFVAMCEVDEDVHEIKELFNEVHQVFNEIPCESIPDYAWKTFQKSQKSQKILAVLLLQEYLSRKVVKTVMVADAKLLESCIAKAIESNDELNLYETLEIENSEELEVGSFVSSKYAVDYFGFKPVEIFEGGYYFFGIYGGGYHMTFYEKDAKEIAFLICKALNGRVYIEVEKR